MAQESRFFDNVNYTESQYAEVQNRLLPEGVIRDIGSQLIVSAPGGMFVRVGSGEGMIQGFWFKNDANLDLAIGANSSGSTRTDAIMLRLNRVTNIVQLVVVPNNPAPTRTPGGDWEMLLATVAVPNAAGAIVGGNITDQRFGALCGFTKNGGFSGGTSRSNVGIYVGADVDTGIYLPAAGNQFEAVAGANAGLIVTATGVSLGTEAAASAVTIGRSGATVTMPGSLSVTDLNVSHPSSTAQVAITSVDGQQNRIFFANTASTKQAWVMLGTNAGQGLGGSGDLSIYTSGAGAGRVVIGAASAARIVAHANGAQIMMGATQSVGFNQLGNVIIGNDTTNAPLGRLHVLSTGAGDGLYFTAPNFASGFSPMISLGETIAVGGTRSGQIALALVAGHFGGTAVGDMFVYTVGSNAGRLLLGTQQIPRIVIKAAGGIQHVQPTDNYAGGIQFRHTNGTHYGSIGVDTNGRPTIWKSDANNVMAFNATSGYCTIGPTASDDARLHVAQQGSGSAEGIRLTWGAGAGNMWVDGSGFARWTAVSNNGVSLLHGASNVVPGVGDQQAALGHASYRWSHLYCMSATFAGALTGITTLGASGTITAGGFSGPVSGTLTGTVISPDCSPSADNTGTCGKVGTMWQNVFTHNGFKPGGGSWTATSDPRTKDKTKERPYESGLDTILRLDPIWFEYNGLYGTQRGGVYAGFDAEAVQAVAPDLVRTYKARRLEEDDPEEDVLAIDSGNVTLMLINAVKELSAEIEELKRDRRN